MARWRPRDPNIYPIAYSEVVLEAQSSDSPVMLSFHPTPYEARMAADRFREWRMCLRKSGFGHRIKPIEESSIIRIKTQEVKTGARLLYGLFVTVKPLGGDILIDGRTFAELSTP